MSQKLSGQDKVAQVSVEDASLRNWVKDNKDVLDKLVWEYNKVKQRKEDENPSATKMPWKVQK